MAQPADMLTRKQVLAAHRPSAGEMFNGFSASRMTCSCGWKGTPGDPEDAGAEMVGHILDILGLVDTDE